MTLDDFLFEAWDLFVIGLTYLLQGLIFFLGYVVAPIVFTAIGCYIAIVIAVETGVL